MRYTDLIQIQQYYEKQVNAKRSYMREGGQKKGVKKVNMVDLLLFPLYCCAGWGYIVAFALTKIFTMYQIYHS
jgi:hypothetical protein